MDASSSTRLMIVDDIPTMLRSLRYALEDQGYQVVAEASDGQEALTLLTREAVDLILADWHMPKMDGLELLRQIRADPATAKLPFLMVTGEIERIRVANAIKAGVTDFVAKPFTPKTLARRVERALRYGGWSHGSLVCWIMRTIAPLCSPRRSTSRCAPSSTRIVNSPVSRISSCSGWTTRCWSRPRRAISAGPTRSPHATPSISPESSAAARRSSSHRVPRTASGESAAAGRIAWSYSPPSATMPPACWPSWACNWTHPGH
jgi:two-component system chemotaxis response regulator CheY